MSQQINLINSDFRPKRDLFTARMLLQAGSGVLILMLAIYAFQYRQTTMLDKQVKGNTILLEQERARLVKETADHAPRPKSVALEQRADELEQRVKGNEAVLGVLQGGSLGNTQGYSDYLRAFARRIVSGVWLTDFSIKGAGMEMSIGGRTLRPDFVPAYIQRLNQEAVLQGRSFAALEMQQPTTPPALRGEPVQIPNYLEFKLHSTPEAATR